MRRRDARRDQEAIVSRSFSIAIAYIHTLAHKRTYVPDVSPMEHLCPTDGTCRLSFTAQESPLEQLFAYVNDGTPHMAIATQPYRVRRFPCFCIWVSACVFLYAFAFEIICIIDGTK